MSMHPSRPAPLLFYHLQEAFLDWFYAFVYLVVHFSLNNKFVCSSLLCSSTVHFSDSICQILLSSSLDSQEQIPLSLCSQDQHKAPHIALWLWMNLYAPSFFTWRRLEDRSDIYFFLLDCWEDSVCLWKYFVHCIPESFGKTERKSSVVARLLSPAVPWKVIVPRFCTFALCPSLQYLFWGWGASQGMGCTTGVFLV